MAKLEPDSSYPLLPPHSSPQFPSPPQHPKPPPYCCNNISYLLTSAAILTILGLTLFLIWPTNLSLHIVRIRLDHIHIFTNPTNTISIDLHLKIRVRNPNFFSLRYDYLNLAICYRSEQLGSVRSASSQLPARGISYVDAELRVEGIQVIHDVFYLIEDLIRGSIPFETVIDLKGILHLLFFHIPIKGRVSCSVNVNPTNQTVVKQDCYPE